MDLNVDLHMICTFWEIFGLAIDFLLNFFNLVTEGEIEFKIGFDFLDTVHDGSMVFNANFIGDFSGT